MKIAELLAALPHRAWQGRPQWQAPNCYPAYVSLAARLQPRTILELGAFEGYGLISFWLGAGPDVQRLDWVDNESYLASSNEHCARNIIEAAQRLGWGPVRVAWARSAGELPDYGPYDLIHVDGDHTTAGALADMAWAWGRGPRYMLVDDFDFLPAVRQAVKRFAAENSLAYEYVKSFRGWALFTRMP